MAEDDQVAGGRLRAETRASSLSAGKRARSFAGNLLGELVNLGAAGSWPPVDVVLIDVATGRTVKTWHEGGADASVLLSVLQEDLAKMPYGEFVEKWDIPSAL